MNQKESFIKRFMKNKTTTIFLVLVGMCIARAARRIFRGFGKIFSKSQIGTTKSEKGTYAD